MLPRSFVRAAWRQAGRDVPAGDVTVNDFVQAFMPITTEWLRVTHINKSLQTEKYARRFLLAVGFGGVGTASFMRQLCLRALQLVGRCLGKVADVGTGAREVSCSILNSKAKTPPGAAMEDMASALMPIMAFLVSYHLGAEWVVLSTQWHSNLLWQHIRVV